MPNNLEFEKALMPSRPIRIWRVLLGMHWKM